MQEVKHDVSYTFNNVLFLNTINDMTEIDEITPHLCSDPKVSLNKRS